MEEKVFIVESKRQGGGSYAPVCVYKTLDGARKFLKEQVDKYGDKDSYTSENSIKINIMGLVYYRITEFQIEQE